MLRRFVNKALIFFVVLVTTSYIFILVGQNNKDALFLKRKKIQEEIEYTSKLLNATSKKKGKTLHNIRLIDRKIKQRQKLISLYQREIIEIGNNIQHKEKRVSALNIELEKQRKYYADFIYYAYKNNTYYTVAVYLLASNTLNQFYMRRIYMDQLNEARADKIKLIDVLKKEIDKEITDLIEDKNSKEITITALKEERRVLSGEKKNRQKRISILSSEEKSLKLQIKEKRRIDAEITNRIEDIIRDEAKKDRFAKLTPEMQLIADNFEKNKGRLPWPTRQGVITEGFGTHWHPVVPGIKTYNGGVDISTVKDEYVRAIYTGTVSNIFSVKGALSYTVVVRHGSYRSVYHNLTNIKVKVGDDIQTKDIIGSVFYKNYDGSSILHLEIWNGFEKVNPEEWISN